MVTVAVALAAGLGALARFLLDTAVSGRRTTFPVGTLVVNVSGSFLLGLVVGLSMHHGLTGDKVAIVGTGLTGGYTTLSTWAWETMALAQREQYRQAVVNAVGSLGLGLGAAAAGLAFALIG